MLFDPGRGISIDDKNRVSRRINFIFLIGLIKQGAFTGLYGYGSVLIVPSGNGYPGIIVFLKMASVRLEFPRSAPVRSALFKIVLNKLYISHKGIA